jgi:signal transduction histidine kinase
MGPRVGERPAARPVGDPEPVERRRGGVARPVPVRRAVGSAILLVAVLAVTLFAVPLAVAAARLYRGEATSRLSAEASRAAGYLSGDALRPGISPGSAPGLPRPRHPETRLAVYDSTGVRLEGDGPGRSSLAAAAARARDEEQGRAGGELAVAVPVRAGGRDVVVRAAIDYDRVLDRTWATFAAMVGLGAVVLGLAALLARRQAGRIAAPLEELTRAARALGEGDFAVETGRSRIYEAAEAGRALRVTARRLGALLERAGSVAADASHQVRTPLTALRLGLERGLLSPDTDRDTVLREALHRADQVESTVEELLARAKDPLAPVGPVDLAGVVEQARTGRWTELAGARHRELRTVVEPGLPAGAATPAVLHQVLDVLVTNALEHGAGPVTVSVRAAGGGLAVDVRDEGPGFDGPGLAAAFRRGDPRARGTGIGLALARDLAESIGGRLAVTDPGPAPVVTLLLRAWRAAA